MEQKPARPSKSTPKSTILTDVFPRTPTAAAHPLAEVVGTYNTERCDGWKSNIKTTTKGDQKHIENGGYCFEVVPTTENLLPAITPDITNNGDETRSGLAESCADPGDESTYTDSIEWKSYADGDINRQCKKKNWNNNDVNCFPRLLHKSA